MKSYELFINSPITMPDWFKRETFQTLKNINNHQQQGTLLQQGNQQQQNNGQNNAASAYQQQLKTLEMQADNDADVVVRSRSL